MDQPDLFLDRTVLAHPQLVASVLMACRSSGRRCLYLQDDRNALLWYGYGQILGSAYSDEALALDKFHADAADELQRLVPSTASLADPIAPIVFLRRAEREGWVHSVEGRNYYASLQLIVALQPPSVLDGLRYWEGTLDEFLEQPYVDLSRSVATPEEVDSGLGAFYKIGSDAAAHVPLVVAEKGWFENGLSRLFLDWCSANPGAARAIQFAGSTVEQARKGNHVDLQEQVRNSLICGLGLCLDGVADYATLSSTTHNIALALGRSGGGVKPILREGGDITKAVASVSSAASTDALAFIVDNSEVVRVLNELFAPAVKRETVGGYVKNFAPRALPSWAQFLYGLGRIAIRRMRARR